MLCNSYKIIERSKRFEGSIRVDFEVSSFISRLSLKIFCVLVLFCCISCSNDNNKKDYISKDVGGFSLIQVDSINYKYPDSVFIGRIGNAISWKNKVVIEDLNFKKVWVFNADFTDNPKIIGRRGSGPGEYKSSAIPFTKGDTLFITDTRYGRCDIYDTNLILQGNMTFPAKVFLNPIRIVPFNNTFIASAMNGESVLGPDYYPKNNSLYVVDSHCQLIKTIFRWGDIYLDKEQVLYADRGAQVNITETNVQKNFAAQQGCDYHIGLFNSNFEQIRFFGKKPLHYRNPPRYSESDVKKFSDRESIIRFVTKITLFLGLFYDKSSDLFIVNYLNPTEESERKRDDAIAEQYIQVYNRDGDVVLDQRISGKVLFIRDSKIYVLADEKADQFIVKVFGIKKIPS